MAKKKSAKKVVKHTTAKVLKDLTYVADVTTGKLGGEIPLAMMELSAANKKKIGLVPGAIFSLSLGRMELTGMVIEGETTDALRQDEFEKRRRKAKNFATARVIGRAISFELQKISRSAPFRFPKDDTVPARLKVIEPPTVASSKSAVKKAARSRSDAIAVPKKLGKPGSEVQKIVDLCGGKDVATLVVKMIFELDGKTQAAMIFISPPVEGVNRLGKAYKIGASITACVGEPSRDGISNPLEQEFRGWPAAVPRAFQWAAKHAKGATLLTKLVDLEIHSRGKKSPPVSKKLKEAATNAWLEVLGIEI